MMYIMIAEMYKISFLFESVLFGTNYCDIPNCLIICMH